MTKTAKNIKQDKMKAKRANLKAERNSKIKGQHAKTKKGAEDAVEATETPKFDEETIKNSIANMLEEYKKAGGVLEMGEEDDEIVDEEVDAEDEIVDEEVDAEDENKEGDTPETAAQKKERKEQREKKKFDFERNNRTIFIGNLPSTYDHRDVTKLFKPCGPVESARIRSVIPEKEKLPPKVAQITKRIHPKINSVNAYLVFEKSDDNEEHIKKALAMNGKVVDEHHIRVDRAQHPNSKRMTLTSRKKSVFVGNLRFDIRDDDLIKHFEKIGPVDYVRLIRDKATGLGKGFGFVKFQERAPVIKAIELNGTQFQGRSLRVKKVDKDHHKTITNEGRANKK